MGIVDAIKLRKVRSVVMENKANNDMIRVTYVCINPYQDVYNKELKCGALYIASSAFKLPKGMTIKQACKVVSYLSEKVEKENDLNPASKESVGMVSHILEDYGFEKNLNIPHEYQHFIAGSAFIKKPDIGKKGIEGVVELFTYGGSSSCFKRSDLYPRYFEWFTPNVSEKEVNNIYTSLNIKLDPQKQTKVK